MSYKNPDKLRKKRKKVKRALLHPQITAEAVPAAKPRDKE